MDSPTPQPNRDERPPRPRAAGRILARSAGAGVIGALIGVTLAVLLPGRPPGTPEAGPAVTSDAAPPAPATRDESLARRRTLDAEPADDTRPDGHTLARRDADRPAPAVTAEPAPPSAAGEPAPATTSGSGRPDSPAPAR